MAKILPGASVTVLDPSEDREQHVMIQPGTIGTLRCVTPFVRYHRCVRGHVAADQMYVIDFPGRVTIRTCRLGLREVPGEDDPRRWRQQYAEGYYGPLAQMIREANQSDQMAGLSGEPALALVSLLDALKRAERNVRTLIAHVCEWNDDDRCNTCGADGRG